MRRRKLDERDRLFLAWLLVLALVALCFVLLAWADVNTVPLV